VTIGTQSGPLFAWGPRGFIARIAGETLDSFCAEYLAAHFLIVRLDDFSSELADGLNTSKPDGPIIRPRRHATSTFPRGDQTDLMSSSAALKGSTTRSSLPASGEFRSAPDLLRSACHVLEIKKRRLEPPVGIVSVGRASDCDIVLQHASVSRKHAQFDYVGGLFVMDLGSSNQTFVNDRSIVDRVPVAFGDSIKFGAVRCSVCSPAGLWRAVHG
jgi:hypothetical protein